MVFSDWQKCVDRVAVKIYQILRGEYQCSILIHPCHSTLVLKIISPYNRKYEQGLETWLSDMAWNIPW